MRTDALILTWQGAMKASRRTGATKLPLPRRNRAEREKAPPSTPLKPTRLRLPQDAFEIIVDGFGGSIESG